MSEIDITDHIVQDEDTERVEIEHNGDTLWFELKELSGSEADRVWDDNLKIDSDGSEIDLHQYKLDYIQKRIVDTNVPKLTIFLKKCESEIYDELSEYVKYPEEGEAIDEGN